MYNKAHWDKTKKNALYRHAEIIESFIKNNYSTTKTMAECKCSSPSVSKALARYLCKPKESIVLMSKI